MATNYNLKFYKGGNQPQEAGSIWFKDGLLSVIGANLQPEYFSGVRDAEWVEQDVTEGDKKYKKKELKLVKADGTVVTLDFSDVASAQVLGTLRTELDDLKATVESNKTAAENGIQEAKDAAQDAADAAGAVAKDLAEYVEANDAAVDVIRKDLAGYKTTNDAAVKGVSDRVTTLENAVTGENGLADKVEALEGLFSGTEGKGVQSMINDSIAGLDADVTSAEGTKVRVQVVEVNGKVTKVKVTEDFKEITDAIAAEASRADAAEKVNAGAIATEKARIDILVGKDDEGNLVDVNKSVREIAAEEVAEIVAGADASYDTLKEIADWIAAHPEDASGYNQRILANKTAIDTLNGNVETEGSVAKAVADAVADAKTEINSTIEENEKTTAAALTDLDGRVDTLEGKVKALEDVNASDRLDALETAVETTLPATIETAKGEAVAAAGTAADTKISTAITNLDLPNTYEAKGAAEALETKLTGEDGAITVNAAGIAANAAAITSLQTKVNEGLSWALFE